MWREVIQLLFCDEHMGSFDVGRFFIAHLNGECAILQYNGDQDRAGESANYTNFLPWKNLVLKLINFRILKSNKFIAWK